MNNLGPPGPPFNNSRNNYFAPSDNPNDLNITPIPALTNSQLGQVNCDQHSPSGCGGGASNSGQSVFPPNGSIPQSRLSQSNNPLSLNEAAAFEAQIRANEMNVGLSPLSPVNDMQQGRPRGELSIQLNRTPRFSSLNKPHDPQELIFEPRDPSAPPLDYEHQLVNDSTRQLIAQLADNFFDNHKDLVHQELFNLMRSIMVKCMVDSLVPIVDTLMRQGQWPWRFCECGGNLNPAFASNALKNQPVVPSEGGAAQNNLNAVPTPGQNIQTNVGPQAGNNLKCAPNPNGSKVPCKCNAKCNCPGCPKRNVKKMEQPEQPSLNSSLPEGLSRSTNESN